MTENNIFISVGSTCNEVQENFVKAIEDRLRSENLIPNTIGRNKFTSDSPLKAIAELIDECSGTIIIALERTFIASGVEKRGGSMETSIGDVKVPTPWNQIEAAMSYAKGKPLMVIIEEGLKNEGLLEKGHDRYVMWLPPDSSSLNMPKFNGFFASWKKKVEDYNLQKREVCHPVVDPSTLTIGYLLKNLKPSQLWTVLGGVVVLLVAAFTFGRFVETLSNG